MKLIYNNNVEGYLVWSGGGIDRIIGHVVISISQAL